MTQTRLEAIQSPETLSDRWTELARESGNIFATWEWASTWLNHRRRKKPLLIFAKRDAEGVKSIFPLYLWMDRPLRVGRFLGHGPADQLGPIGARGDVTSAAAALTGVADAADLDLLLVELLPGDEVWGPALSGSTLVHESSPTSSLEGGWDGYLSRRSANFRQQVRRRERNLMRRYKLRYRLANEETLHTDLGLLFSLHNARWSASRSAFERWQAFHRDFASVALERGWLRIWFLELDGSPAAAWYGYRFGGVESYYQSGRDPAHNDDSVGFVLLAHSIRAAAEDGIREYRFLRGDETYKRRFADSDEGLETVAVARGVRGKIAAGTAAALVRHGSLRSPMIRLGRLR